METVSERFFIFFPIVVVGRYQNARRYLQYAIRPNSDHNVPHVVFDEGWIRRLHIFFDLEFAKPFFHLASEGSYPFFW